jgi:hypothetical protein
MPTLPTIESLAERHGVSRKQIHKYAKAGGWQKQREGYKSDRRVEADANRAVRGAERMETSIDAQLSRAEQIGEQIDQMVTDLPLSDPLRASVILEKPARAAFGVQKQQRTAYGQDDKATPAPVAPPPPQPAIPGPDNPVVMLLNRARSIGPEAFRALIDILHPDPPQKIIDVVPERSGSKPEELSGP